MPRREKSQEEYLRIRNLDFDSITELVCNYNKADCFITGVA